MTSCGSLDCVLMTFIYLHWLTLCQDSPPMGSDADMRVSTCTHKIIRLNNQPQLKYMTGSDHKINWQHERQNVR